MFEGQLTSSLGIPFHVTQMTRTRYTSTPTEDGREPTLSVPSLWEYSTNDFIQGPMTLSRVYVPTGDGRGPTLGVQSPWLYSTNDSGQGGRPHRTWERTHVGWPKSMTVFMKNDRKKESALYVPASCLTDLEQDSSPCTANSPLPPLSFAYRDT